MSQVERLLLLHAAFGCLPFSDKRGAELIVIKRAVA